MHALLGMMATAPTEPDPSIVTPGLLGLALVLALGAAVGLLYRSMNRQLKRVDFPEPHEAAEQEPGSDERKPEQ